MVQAIILRMRGKISTKLAFEEWWKKYQKETGKMVTQEEAFEELMRRAGVLPPKGITI